MIYLKLSLHFIFGFLLFFFVSWSFYLRYYYPIFI
uniref:Uncharacterized protein n=1 Tax=Anguilla anguilla TaxID=7936 RepID=A0A0E9SMT6_ANGAN